MIRARLATGYQQGGFPDAKILPRWDEEHAKIIIDVHAGQRYRKGRVEVTKTDRTSRQMLEDWTLKQRPPRNACPVTVITDGKPVTRWVRNGRELRKPQKALWTPGKVASFHLPDVEFIRSELQRCCAAQGFYQANVTVDLRPEDDGTVTLAVAVTEEGERATLAGVKITGLEQNSEDDVLKLLDLQAGKEFTETLIPDVQRKLFESGKFLEYDVRLGKPQGASISLDISLYEDEQAVPLAEPRPDVEEAACRLANWFNLLPEAEDDVLVEGQFRDLCCECLDESSESEDDPNPDLRPDPDPHEDPVENSPRYSLRLAFSPRRQTTCAEIRRNSETNDKLEYGLALQADPTNITATAFHRGERFTIPHVNNQFAVQVIGTTHRPNLEGNHSRLMMGAGVRGSATGVSPIVIDFLISPAFLLREFGRDGQEFVVENGHGIPLENGRLEMDMATGRLIECRIDLGDDTYFVIRTGQDLFASFGEGQPRDSEGFTQTADIERPVTSLMRFALGCIDPATLAWEHDPETSSDEIKRMDRGLEAARTIVRPGLLQPLDALASKFLRDIRDGRNRDNEFTIPPRDTSSPDSTWEVIYRMANALLPEQSWGYRVINDFRLVQNNVESPEVHALFDVFNEDITSGKLGPFASFSSALLYPRAQSEERRHYAQTAIDRLSLESTRRDLEDLVTPGSPLGHIVEALVGAIGDCSEDEWACVVDALIPGARDAALPVGQTCRKFREHPREAFPAIIEQLYPNAIEPLLLSSLKPMVPVAESELYDSSEEPQDAEGYCTRGYALTEKGNFDRAISDFDEAIRLDAKCSDAYCGRAKIAFDRKQYDKAIADADEAIRLDPHCAIVYCIRGASRGGMGELDQALSDLDEAIRLDPEDAQAYYHRAYARMSKREFEKALSDCSEAIRLDSQSSWSYCVRGETLAGMEKWADALNDFNEAIRLDPRLAHAYEDRGYVWLKRSEYDKAIDDYTEALRLDPQLASAHLNRGYAWHMRGDLDKAIDDYTAAVRLNPESSEYQDYLADAQNAREKKDKSLTDYTKAIRLDPNSADAYLSRGGHWRRLHLLDMAISDFNEAIRINPKSAKAYCDRGSARAEKGEFDKAAGRLRRCDSPKSRDGGRLHIQGLAWRPARRTNTATALRPFSIPERRAT
ncbi:MAG: tetratricopeptide repeat protein [Planctomycetaceae bacterium]